MGELQTYSVKDWVVFGINKFPSPFKITDALVNEARIVHVVKGRSRLYAADHFLDLGSGDTIVMKTDNFVNNWLENETGESNVVIAFQLNADLLKHLYNDGLPSWFQDRHAPRSPSLVKVDEHLLIDQYFKTLSTYLENRSLLTEEIIQLKIRELLSLLIETDQSGKIRNIFGHLFSASDHDFRETIQKNLFEDLGVEELAFLAGLSLSSFKRKFNTVFGTSPNRYITLKRLEQSHLLLKSTDHSITEVAYQCGFSDVGYFSKVFKGHYGMLPSELRK